MDADEVRRKYLPYAVHDFPIILLSEFDRTTKKTDIICGFQRDYQLLQNRGLISREQLLTVMTNERVYAEQCVSRVSYRHLANVQRIEIELLLDVEKAGRCVFFYLRKCTASKNWLKDWVYMGRDPCFFDGEKILLPSYSSWELTHLLPLFPNICTIVWDEDEGKRIWEIA